MAVEIRRVQIDDYTGGEVDGFTTVAFMSEGCRWEIDLGDESLKVWDDVIGPFRERARLAGGANGRHVEERGRHVEDYDTRKAKETEHREELARVRLWWKDNQEDAKLPRYKFAQRIPQIVTERYKMAKGVNGALKLPESARVINYGGRWVHPDHVDRTRTVRRWWRENADVANLPPFRTLGVIPELVYEMFEEAGGRPVTRDMFTSQVSG